MRISLHTSNESYLNEIKYVLDFINNHPLKPQQVTISHELTNADVVIYYSAEKTLDAIWIPQQGLIFGEKIIYTQDLFCNVYQKGDSCLYSVESKKKEEKPFFNDSNFGFDIIEAIFFHISRYEEYHCLPELKDQWGMMHEKKQFSVIHGIYQVPVVDRLVRMFFVALGLTVEDQPTKYAMTHDIDVLAKFENTTRKIRSTIRSTMDHGLEGLMKASKTIAKVSKGTTKDPYDTFDDLFTKRTFDKKICYIMAGGETKHDNYYSIDSPEAMSVITEASSKDYEIGIHPSYNAGYKEHLYQKEKETLERILKEKVSYSRQHFLRYDFKITPHILDTNTINQDSTLGYQRLIGYRCGTGFPYHLFDFEKRTKFNHVELPMVIMDGGLLEEAGQDLEKAKDILTQFLNENRSNTYITFNFHNTIFDPLKRDTEKMLSLYQQCLDTVK